MNKTEVKKILYKQKPIAEFTNIRNGITYYRTTVTVSVENIQLFFEVPVSDMGTADFRDKMEAQHLIRWLINY